MHNLGYKLRFFFLKSCQDQKSPTGSLGGAFYSGLPERVSKQVQGYDVPYVSEERLVGEC